MEMVNSEIAKQFRVRWQTVKEAAGMVTTFVQTARICSEVENRNTSEHKRYWHTLHNIVLSHWAPQNFVISIGFMFPLGPRVGFPICVLPGDGLKIRYRIVFVVEQWLQATVLTVVFGPACIF